MTRHRSAIQVNAQFALQGDHAAARQALADFCETVGMHLHAYRPGERLGPVEVDPTLAYHLASAFERILKGTEPAQALGVAFERGRKKNRDSERLAQRDSEIEAAFWYLSASGLSRPDAIRATATIVSLTQRQTSRKVAVGTVSEARFLATLAEGPLPDRLTRLAELSGRYRSEIQGLLTARAVRPRRVAAALRRR